MKFVWAFKDFSSGKLLDNKLYSIIILVYDLRGQVSCTPVLLGSEVSDLISGRVNVGNHFFNIVLGLVGFAVSSLFRISIIQVISLRTLVSEQRT